jgi:hypothetical protein
MVCKIFTDDGAISDGEDVRGETSNDEEHVGCI